MSRRSCSGTARPVIGPAKRRRSRCSPMNRRVRGRRPSKTRCCRRRCRPGSPIRSSGSSSNDPSLSQSDIDTLVAWVDAGAPMGDPKDMPAPRQFVEGWTIPKPDIVFQLPKPFPVPATGVMEYQYVIIPTGFTKDTWVQQVQAAPTNYSVVHHIVAYVRAPGLELLQGHAEERVLRGAPVQDRTARKRRRTTCRTTGSPVTRPASRPTCSSPARPS